MDEKARRRLERVTQEFYDSDGSRESQNQRNVKTRLLPGGASFLVCSLVIVVVLIPSLWRLFFSGGSVSSGPPAGDQEVDSSQSAGAQSGVLRRDDASVKKVTGKLPGKGVSAPGAQSGVAGASNGGSFTQGKDLEGESPQLIVYVTGHVKNPGVVRLHSGQRIIDAVHASGGFLPEADQQSINMARPLVDGEHINIWKIGEVPPHFQDGPGKYLGQGNLHVNDGSSVGGLKGLHGGCVDINMAGAEELQRLNGVGPALAKRILSHRQKVGSMTSVDQLKDVKGIGNALFEKISENLCQ